MLKAEFYLSSIVSLRLFDFWVYFQSKIIFYKEKIKFRNNNKFFFSDRCIETAL